VGCHSAPPRSDVPATPAPAPLIVPVPPAPATNAAAPIAVPPPPVMHARVPLPVTLGIASPLDQYLAWDSGSKEVTVSNGTPTAHFTFTFTNISAGLVVITSAKGSCFCTVAELPETPWTNAPGAVNELHVNMDLRGKFGTLFKTVTVDTVEKGAKVLMVKTTIRPPSAAESQAMDRDKNRQMALADRQAIFKNDCAQCHVDPAKNKLGEPLYAAACGICHEDAHRATMVPDLHAIPQETNAEFWRNWVTYGKPGTLMPAFAKSEGGILTEAQVASLVNYLTATIPSKAAR
jgi:mono/diheme cytochrome c family protein